MGTLRWKGMPRLFFSNPGAVFDLTADQHRNPIQPNSKTIESPKFLCITCCLQLVWIYFKYLHTLPGDTLCKSKIQLFNGRFLPYRRKKNQFPVITKKLYKLYKEGKLQFHELQKYVNFFSFLDTLWINFEQFSTPYSLKHQFYFSVLFIGCQVLVLLTKI